MAPVGSVSASSIAWKSVGSTRLTMVLYCRPPFGKDGPPSSPADDPPSTGVEASLARIVASSDIEHAASRRGDGGPDGAACRLQLEHPKQPCGERPDTEDNCAETLPPLRALFFWDARSSFIPCLSFSNFSSRRPSRPERRSGVRKSDATRVAGCPVPRALAGGRSIALVVLASVAFSPSRRLRLPEEGNDRRAACDLRGGLDGSVPVLAGGARPLRRVGGRRHEADLPVAALTATTRSPSATRLTRLTRAADLTRSQKNSLSTGARTFASTSWVWPSSVAGCACERTLSSARAPFAAPGAGSFRRRGPASESPRWTRPARGGGSPLWNSRTIAPSWGAYARPPRSGSTRAASIRAIANAEHADRLQEDLEGASPRRPSATKRSICGQSLPVEGRLRSTMKGRASYSASCRVGSPRAAAFQGQQRRPTSRPRNASRAALRFPRGGPRGHRPRAPAPRHAARRSRRFLAPTAIGS